MKTAFERDGYMFEPEPVIYSTGPDGRARVVRRFYSPRTPKKDIR
jgi:hypothetical protein